MVAVTIVSATAELLFLRSRLSSLMPSNVKVETVENNDAAID